MAENKEREPEQERKIPVFTVMKNGAVLKNIFLIDKPPLPPSVPEQRSITSVENEESPDEEILTVGRHPDCHIMLTHPSISRFHLQILSKPSSQKLSVVDLSSVHGTWVSEKKIEPGVIVELNEGDTLKIGGSTRVYRLHWVPFSRAYDMDNSFISPLDLSMIEVKEDEDQVLEEKSEMETHPSENSMLIENGKTEVEDSVAVSGKEDKTCQDENFLLIEIKPTEGKDSMVEERKEEGKYQDEISVSIQDKETQPLDLILEGIVSLFTDEISELISKKEIPFFGTESVDLSFPVGVSNSASVEQQLNKDNQMPQPGSMMAVISEKENIDGVLRRSGNTVNLFASPSETKESGILEEMDSQSDLPKECDPRDTLKFFSGSPMKNSLNLSLGFGEVSSEIKTEKLNKENQTHQSLAVLQPVFEIVNNENSSLDQNLNSLINQKSTWFDVENCCPWAEVLEESENQSISRKGHTQKEIPSSSSLLEAESVNSYLPFGEVLSEIMDNKKCQTPQSLFVPEGLSVLENSESSPVRSGKRSSSRSIWSRRGKPASDLQIHTSKSRGKTIGDCENLVLESSQADNMENKSVSKILFSDLEEMEEETFTPDKENFTPSTLLLKSLERKGKLEEIKHSKSRRTSSSKVAFSPNVQLEEDVARTSDKENKTPKVLRERKPLRDASRNQVELEEERALMKARAERLPFKTLFANSPGKSRSQASLSKATTKSSDSVNFTRTTEVTNSSSFREGRRSWTMVVDTTTLLDKESRKSLQLLQGLKGTQLIIPRMVIRELDCLKRRGSLFRRTSEVSSVLGWIEECMVKTKWWIHIQRSVEEGRPIAPTPPASPKSQFSEGSVGFPCGTTGWGPFSSRTSLTEIVSPTAEDHILDCALLFRKMKNDGHLVLLSNNVTMKIKAMAEGLICETVQEFRESLVNPFSERFLWAESSPRGLTWSHLDDVVLREKYTRGTLKKPSKGGDDAKGLKLILLHNSHYANINSVR